MIGEFNNPLDVLKHLKEFDYYQNANILYRILLTIDGDMCKKKIFEVKVV